MCSKPKLNSSEDFREGLKRYLQGNMLHNYEQFPKVGRLNWWQRLLDRIERLICGR